MNICVQNNGNNVLSLELTNEVNAPTAIGGHSSVTWTATQLSDGSPIVLNYNGGNGGFQLEYNVGIHYFGFSPNELCNISYDGTTLTIQPVGIS